MMRPNPVRAILKEEMMSDHEMIELVPLAGIKLDSDEKGGPSTLVIFAGQDFAMATATATLAAPALAQIRKAAGAAKFKCAAATFLEILAPHGLNVDRLVVAGTHIDKAKPQEISAIVNHGGALMGKLHAGHCLIAFDMLDAPQDVAASAADFILGMKLRAYKFDRYKTRKKDDATDESLPRITFAVADMAAAEEAIRSRTAIAEGVILARTLVNEPPNVLHPEELADRAKELEKLGVEIAVLDEKAMGKLGMGALLGVGQGSRRESRLVVMRWRGGKAAKDKKSKPIAFIGKGVTFDTGGISIKQAASMEDMKGDMAGAACVVGLMHALASRKAKVDVIGAIGIVENMPDGNAMRPGDIVTSMSGQTIEIINTDAEGRLVLSDVLWYIQDKYQPAFMIDLATLTGAILVALGQEYAGLFSNSDELSTRLTHAGLATGEKVWRMPMGPTYDKMIDSKFADMKNTGGRHGGSSTAAQFLQRFVNETPWAHLDIAGTGMSSAAGDINQSWASGWGVRLLDRLVADHYENK